MDNPVKACFKISFFVFSRE